MRAAQKTSRKLSPLNRMSAIAMRGPVTNPKNASARRKPKPVPLRSEAVMSATKASRGASRMPLPRRSMTGAVTTLEADSARGNTVFTSEDNK